MATCKPVILSIELWALLAAVSSAIRWKMFEATPFQNVRPIRVEEIQPGFFAKSDLQKLMAVIAEEWLKEIAVFLILIVTCWSHITELELAICTDRRERFSELGKIATLNRNLVSLR